MPFGNKALPSRRYSYGAYDPVENLDLVLDQIRLAHCYRNKLVEIERRRRELADQAVFAAHPCLADLRAVAEADGSSEESRQEYYQARRAAFTGEAVRPGLEAIDCGTADEARTARSRSGLYWGTYLVVEASTKNFRRGAPPRFVPFRGEGVVAVQLQKGLAVEDALRGVDRRLRIGLPGKNGATLVSVRVGSVGKGGREPVWAVIPTVFHRPLKEGTRIQWVELHRRRCGTGYNWTVQFILADEGGWKGKSPVLTEGVVGIDVGWRKFPDGSLRVAVAYSEGDEGAVVEELRLSDREVSGWRRADTLRQTRDDNFNKVKGEFSSWLDENGQSLPDWLREGTESLCQWRSQARLAALVIRWGGRLPREERSPEPFGPSHGVKGVKVKPAFSGFPGERFPGDEEIFDRLESWRKQDKHLWEWEANQRRKSVVRREHLYSNWVAGLRKRYSLACVEKMDCRDLATRGEGEVWTMAEYYRQVAAVGRLLALIKERFGKVVEVPAENTTRACSRCGSPEEWDQAKSLVHTCGECGETWDQDENAARNLWMAASGSVVS